MPDAELPTEIHAAIAAYGTLMRGHGRATEQIVKGPDGKAVPKDADAAKAKRLAAQALEDVKSAVARWGEEQEEAGRDEARAGG